jgi:hypothetical protein
MQREEDEQLWDLLGQAKAPPVSPFFARNVLRAVRREPPWKSLARSWLSLRRLVPATGVAAIALLAGVMLVHRPAPHKQAAPADLDPIAKIDPQDYEVVADLDDLLASEENNLWDDSSSL